jgi:hypothetical protein
MAASILAILETPVQPGLAIKAPLHAPNLACLEAIFLGMTSVNRTVVIKTIDHLNHLRAPGIIAMAQDRLAARCQYLHIPACGEHCRSCSCYKTGHGTITQKPTAGFRTGHKLKHWSGSRYIQTASTKSLLPWWDHGIAILRVPSVLDMMARDPAWTQQLGNAVLVPYYDPVVVFARPRPGFVVGTAIRFGPAVTISATFGTWGWWTGPAFFWPAHTIVVGGHPWERGWVNRGVYVHPYAHPWIRPIGPRVEIHHR